MGCNASKRIEAAVDVYRPASASFAVFDINAIEEPWLKVDNTQQQQQQEKPTHLPLPILEKLKTFEFVTDAPRSWDEVSKALEDLKPTLRNSPVTSHSPPKPEPVHSPAPQGSTDPKNQTPQKSVSFHTLEELDAKLSPKPTELRQTESMKTDSVKTELKKPESRAPVVPPADSGGFKPVRENIFIVRDRLEREREGKASNFEKMMMSRRDPLGEYPEKCPPGGADSVVLYTTSMRGVRRTYEDCNRARAVLEGHRVVFDERDVALHGEFLSELRGLVGEGASVPRLFVKGRYVGGAEEVLELDESGRLGRMMNWARVERGVGRQACEGCGGARFVPCLECAGSCKVLKDGNSKERCSKCNENGLVHCPACL